MVPAPRSRRARHHAPIPMIDTPSIQPTAAVLIIGDEILSGRTQDVNLAMIASCLTEWGVALMEARVVPDERDAIVHAVNAVRETYDYVFTTGGIGPTHDDITADCIAAAFGVGISERADARAILEARYTPGDLTPARLRMARIPDGAALIDNPVSGAPGFHLGNVFVMAGVPVIAEAMMLALRHLVAGGPPTLSATVKAVCAESTLAGALERVQEAFRSVKIGSYPFLYGGRAGVNVVLRATDAAALEAARAAVLAELRAIGVEPVAEQ